MFRPRLESLIVLLLVVFCAVSVTIDAAVVEWGARQSTALTNIANTVTTPQLVTQLGNGSVLPDFTLMAATDSFVVGMTSSQTFYIAGNVDGIYGGTKGMGFAKLALQGFTGFQTDPVVKLVGVNSALLAQTTSGKVYSWLVGPKHLAQNADLTTYTAAGRNFTNAALNPLDLVTPAPLDFGAGVNINGLSCSTTHYLASTEASYCIAWTSTTLFIWGEPSATAFILTAGDFALPTNISTIGLTFSANSLPLQHGINITSVTTGPTAFMVIASTTTFPQGNFWFTTSSQLGSPYFSQMGLEATGLYQLLAPADNQTILSTFGLNPSKITLCALGALHGVMGSSSMLFAWGSNSEGQLGIGIANTTVNPALIQISFPSGTRFLGVSALGFTNFALTYNIQAPTAGNQLWVWGLPYVPEGESSNYASSLLYDSASLFSVSGAPTFAGSLLTPILVSMPDGFVPATAPAISLNETSASFHVAGTYSVSAPNGNGNPPSASPSTIPSGAPSLVAGWGKTIRMQWLPSFQYRATAPYIPQILLGGTPLGNLTSSPYDPAPAPTLAALPQNGLEILSISVHNTSVAVLVSNSSGYRDIYVWGTIRDNFGVQDIEPTIAETQNIPSAQGTASSLAYPHPLIPYYVTLPTLITPFIDPACNTSTEQLCTSGTKLAQRVNNLSSIAGSFIFETASNFSVWTGNVATTTFSNASDVIACGYPHCARWSSADHSLWMWSISGVAETAYYGLGNATSVPVNSPPGAQVATNVSLFALGMNISAIVNESSPGYPFYQTGICDHGMCWGGYPTDNGYTTWTQLPMDDWIAYNSPLPATNEISSLSAGFDYFMGIYTNSSGPYVFGWGANDVGQVMGTSSPSNPYYSNLWIPFVLPRYWYNSATPVAVSCVSWTTFLLATEPGNIQVVYAWGFNGLGQMYGDYPDVYHSWYVDAAFQINPVATLGLPTSYIVSSIPSSPSSLTTFISLAQSPTMHSVNPASSISSNNVPPIVLTVGHDLDPSNPYYYNYHGFFPHYQGPTMGTEIPTGDISSDENVTMMAFSNYGHWYLTSSNRLYATGSWGVVPFYDADGVWEENIFQQHTPQLILDCSACAKIIKLEAYTTSVVALFNNGSAISFWSQIYNGIYFNVLPNAPSGATPILDADNGGIPIAGYNLPFAVNATVGNYSDVACASLTCCFLVPATDTLACYGEPVPNVPSSAFPATGCYPTFTSVVSYDITLYDPPSFNLVHCAITRFAIIDNIGVLLLNTTGDWSVVLDNSLGYPTEIANITTPNPASVLQIETGADFALILIADQGMFTLGANEFQTINASCDCADPALCFVCPWQHEMFPHYSNKSSATSAAWNHSIAQVAAWSYSILILTRSGELYGIGSKFWVSGDYDAAGLVQTGFQVAPSPQLVPVDSKYSILQLFSRHTSYNQNGYFINQNLIDVDHMVAMLVQLAPVLPAPTPMASPVPTPVPITITPSATPVPIPAPLTPPTTAALVCQGAPPFGNSSCTCLNGAWYCTGNISTSTIGTTSSTGTIVIGSPLVLNGSLTIDTPNVEIPAGSLLTNTSTPFITVSGCISLNQPLTISINSTSQVESIHASGGVTTALLQSSCYQNSSNLVNVQQSADNCKKVGVNTNQNTDSSARVTLTATLAITSNSCSTWWIVLVSVIGGVVVIAIIVAIVVTSVRKFRLVVKPFHGSNVTW